MENKRILVGLIIVLVSFGLCGCGITNSTAKKAANPKIIDMFTKEKVEEAERRVTAEVTESVSEKIARNLLNKNLTVDEIAKATGLSVNHIKSL